MKSSLLLFLLSGSLVSSALAQVVPDGYILQYAQNFNRNSGLQDFRFSYPPDWAISKMQGNYCLQFNRQANSDSPSTTIAPNRAILKNRIFGDFILEVDVMPFASEASSQEVIIFVGLKDSTRHYFILLSTDPAGEMQGIYLVKNSVSTKLSVIRYSSGSLIPNTWQKIRIERDIVKRTIRVFSGNPAQPVMEVRDYELVMGSVGLGSLYSAARFDNLSIWAPTVIVD